MVTAIIGIFSVGAFTIPVGILGAGFEQWVDPGDDDDDEEDEDGEEEKDEEAEAASITGTVVELQKARSRYEGFIGWFSGLPDETKVAIAPDTSFHQMIQEKQAMVANKARTKKDKRKTYRGSLYLFVTGQTKNGHGTTRVCSCRWYIL